MSSLLEVADLVVRLPLGGAMRPVLRGIDLQLDAGEALGLVGESGSGKSMTAKAIDRLLPAGAEVDGVIRFDGADVAGLRSGDLRRFRREVSMIFQDPRSHINPVRRIGDFMTEAVIAHGTMNRSDATTLAVDLLTAVRISNPEDRLNRFPHELSGGMLQRVMIASALMGSPRLVLADEPTTALDVTTQAEVMAILDELRRERGLAMVFITHDLELAAAVCDRTAVMYAGQIVEINTSRHIEHDPLHPYTSALLRSRPRIDVTLPRLEAIPGQPLSSFEAPEGSCAFAGRCPHATDACRTTPPRLVEMDGGASRCVRVDELRGTLHGVDA